MASTGIRIAVDGDTSGEDLESLAGWLVGEPALAGQVRRQSGPLRAGQMGTVTDALVVSVGASGAVTALISCLQTWLSRPRHNGVKLQVWQVKEQVKADGSHTTEVVGASLTLDSGSEVDVEGLVREVIADAWPGSAAS